MADLNDDNATIIGKPVPQEMLDRIVLCSVCGSNEVICYRDPNEAVCPDHCPDHEWEYERGERRWECKTCGVPAPPEFYENWAMEGL